MRKRDSNFPFQDTVAIFFLCNFTLETNYIPGTVESNASKKSFWLTWRQVRLGRRVCAGPDPGSRTHPQVDQGYRSVPRSTNITISLIN
jgi:hypothetical protein